MYDFYEEVEKKIHSKFIDEMLEKIPLNYWETLGKYNGGCITIHTINVMYKTITDKFYLKQLSKYEQNILKWAALLHDITKRGTPEFEGQDHIHPFNSGMATLEIFRNLKILNINDKEQEDLYN
jgi:hypothetical protein